MNADCSNVFRRDPTDLTNSLSSGFFYALFQLQHLPDQQDVQLILVAGYGFLALARAFNALTFQSLIKRAASLFGAEKPGAIGERIDGDRLERIGKHQIRHGKPNRARTQTGGGFDGIVRPAPAIQQRRIRRRGRT